MHLLHGVRCGSAAGALSELSWGTAQAATADAKGQGGLNRRHDGPPSPHDSHGPRFPCIRILTPSAQQTRLRPDRFWCGFAQPIQPGDLQAATEGIQRQVVGLATEGIGDLVAQGIQAEEGVGPPRGQPLAPLGILETGDHDEGLASTPCGPGST